jgi:hypothetical protein
MPSTLPFDVRVRELCQQLIECKTQSEAAELAHQLQTLIHERIEELRGYLATLVIAGVLGETTT